MNRTIRLLLGALLLCFAASAQAQLAANPAELQLPEGVVGQGEQGGLQAQSLNFGVQARGTTVGPLDVTLHNTSAASLTVGSLTPATGVYARVGGSCGTVPFTLASQASCTLGYTFTPNGIGEFRQYLYLGVTPNVGPTVYFDLTGEGDIGHPTVQPSNIYFLPYIVVGEISQEAFVTLQNTGRVPMQVLGIAPYDPPPVASFVRTGGSCGTPPFTLYAYASCTVGFTFAPIAVGEIRMDVEFAHNVGSAESVTLIGVGLPESPIFANGFD